MDKSNNEYLEKYLPTRPVGDIIGAKAAFIYQPSKITNYDIYDIIENTFTYNKDFVCGISQKTGKRWTDLKSVQMLCILNDEKHRKHHVDVLELEHLRLVGVMEDEIMQADCQQDQMGEDPYDYDSYEDSPFSKYSPEPKYEPRGDPGRLPF